MPPLALLSKASLLLAAAAIPTSRSKRPDACDSVRQQLEAAQPPNSTSPENASSPSSPARILGQDAHDCLKSLPFESERAKRFVGELRKYVEFQSTLEALRKPPDSYASDPVDILGLMEQIGRIDYKSLYDFDVDLKALFASAHDGHFSVRPCSTSIFAFQRDHGGIVSVSQDGLTLPELFVYSDLEAPMPGNASISPITEINGQAALEYLQAITRTSPSQDPDSRWNELFRSLAWNDRGGVPPNGSFIDNGGSWPGAGKTTIKFANRSSIEIETLAELSGYEDFNSSSASEVLATYCRPPTGPPDPPPPPLGPFETGIQSYPEPLLRDPHNQVTGYFLDNETAVMVVASFDGGEEPRDISRDFANVTADLVARAKASGRDKLIVDVSGNPGGSPTRLLNMFKVLFPDQFPFDALRFRRSVATDTLAKVFGALNGTEALAFGTDFAFSAMVAPDQKAGFPTALDFLGAGEAQLGVTVSGLHVQFLPQSNRGRSDSGLHPCQRHIQGGAIPARGHLDHGQRLLPLILRRICQPHGQCRRREDSGVWRPSSNRAHADHGRRPRRHGPEL